MADKETPIPDYHEKTAGFVDSMVQELEANFYKGDPEPWTKLTPAQAMGEIFYHQLKLAWFVKHKPEDKNALAELAADVANCAMIAADSLEVTELPTGPATFINEAGKPEDFNVIRESLIAWLEEHFGWTEDDLAVNHSEGVAQTKPDEEKADESQKQQ